MFGRARFPEARDQSGGGRNQRTRSNEARQDSTLNFPSAESLNLYQGTRGRGNVQPPRGHGGRGGFFRERQGHFFRERQGHFFRERPGQSRGQRGGGHSNMAFGEPEEENIEKGIKNCNRRNIMGFKRLEELCKSDTIRAFEVLCNPTCGYIELIKNKPKPDFVFLIFRLLNKICDSEFNLSTVTVLRLTCCPEFLDHLQLFLTALLTMDKRKIVHLNDFFNNLTKFFSKVLDVLPQTAAERLRSLLVVTEVTLTGLETYQGIEIETNVKENLAALMEKFKDIDSEAKINKNELSRTHEKPPPNDFREISLYPTSQDLLGRNYLRKNIVDGSYRDTYHYLDVQFRLLREDFIDPLRVGIKTYWESLTAETKERKRNHHIKTYRNVMFVEQQILKDRHNIYQKIQFFDPNSRDYNPLKKINWESSKRFTFGSLLLFTNNNFETFFMATVGDRDITQLSGGFLLVSLIGETPENLAELSYLMAESSIFFEPYFQVLKVIQGLPLKLPMERYILMTDCNPAMPQYFSPDSIITLQGNKVQICEPVWPSIDELKVNISQFTALKAALTNELVVIQGPPGTGKTYLGLMLAKILLQNKTSLKVYSPLMVVCYTNHALDQFLEGLLDATEKIVRIGGQSKNEALEPYNLRNISRKFRYDMGKSKSNVIKKIQSLRSAIIEYSNLEALLRTRNGILDPGILKCVMKPTQSKAFVNSASFMKWLTGHEFKNMRVFESDLGVLKSVSNEDSENEIDDDDDDDDGGNNIRRNVYQEELDKEIFSPHDVNIIKYAIDLKKLSELTQEVEAKVARVNKIAKLDYEEFYSMILDIDFLAENSVALDKLTNLIAKNVKPSLPLKELNKANPWSLEEQDRWCLYWHWVEGFSQSVTIKANQARILYNQNIKHLEELNEMEYATFIRQNKTDVIGLTTTGAAKHRALIQGLHPEIVIVEEAAEVLEAHIIASLTSQVKHLILIGDHKQLQPNPATYKLAKDYGLDISLFERMLKNGLACNTLDVQHRMRPEISQLIVPTIYDKLEDHESVFEFPRIKGVSCNMFFVNHNHPEREVPEIDSQSNIHEVEFIIELCRYLVLQNYSPDDITVLTTYSGQLFQFRSARKKYADLLKGVRFTVVDNFQGEENKIILLSLVRSNAENKIGFLSKENRVCVALSRAKHGFFIIGNMTCLSEGSEIWKRIHITLTRLNAIGTHLSLECQVHKKVTNVSQSQDFQPLMEGGCDQICEQLLHCGHSCKRLCHNKDFTHENYKCYQKCARQICTDPLNHPCPKDCYVECGQCKVQMERRVDCGHLQMMACHTDPKEFLCKFPVEATLPDCGHRVKKPCHIALEEFKCTEPCDTRLDCGHSCTMRCHMKNDPDHLNFECRKPCGKLNLNCSENHPCNKRCYEACEECSILVTKVYPCSHHNKLKCSEKMEDNPCKKPCKKQLPCNHNCKLKCSEQCGNCLQKVKKIIPECGHEISVICKIEVSRKLCLMPCNRNMNCGHPCKGVCKDDCNANPCEEIVPLPMKGACGHNAYGPCSSGQAGASIDPSSDLVLRNCKEPCRAQLPCGDICQGTCGECMQGRIHQPCQSQCGNTLVCGHACQVPCRQGCPPCTKKCEYKCTHSKCKKRCGDPCSSCQEPCVWQCTHFKCKKKCGQICDRPVCNYPCLKILSCGHDCVGMCGETCPPLCRICDQEKLTELFFGEEDEDDARFVFLEDCKHVVEVTGLDRWVGMSIKGETREIGLITCPKCKMPIKSTLRYKCLVIKTYSDIQKVKRKIFGLEKTITAESANLKNKFKVFTKFKIPSAVQNSEAFRRSELMLQQKVPILSKKNNMALAEVKGLVFLLEFMTTMIKKISLTPQKLGSLSPDQQFVLTARLDLLLSHLYQRSGCCGEVELKSFIMELKRFSRLVDYQVTLSEPVFKQATTNSYCSTEVFDAKIALDKQIFSVEKYTDFADEQFIETLNKFKKLIASSGKITKDEFNQIHEAMKKSFNSHSKQGHWFICSKGHLYAITECGGAMEEGVCPECGEVIGGSSHRLVSTSRLANLDGARFPAWSEQNNANNYMFDNI